MMKHALGAKLLLIGSALLACNATAHASERNDLPSCYDNLRLSEFKPQAVNRDLIMLVDKTVVFPKDIVSSAIAQAQRFTQAGDRISIYSFSAFVGGEYLNMEWAGRIETPPTAQTADDMPIMKTKSLERCLQEQLRGAQVQIDRTVQRVASTASNDIARSEIIFTLRKVGEDMRARNMKNTRIFMISDMLENSDYLTFYAGNAIAAKDPAASLQKLKQGKLLGDLSGAQVYVTGAGITTPNIKTSYRSGDLLDQLERFWASYISSSNGKLAAFGAPKLNSDLK